MTNSQLCDRLAWLGFAITIIATFVGVFSDSYIGVATFVTLWELSAYFVARAKRNAWVWTQLDSLNDGLNLMAGRKRTVRRWLIFLLILLGPLSQELLF